jgi:peptide/nickel transport system permease protein
MTEAKVKILPEDIKQPHNQTEEIAAYKVYKKKSIASEMLRRFKKNRLACISTVVLAILILITIFADFICNYQLKAITQNYTERLQGPNLHHLLGTDAYGRDIFARVIHGSRLSLSIGFLVIISSLIVGTIFGAISGFYGGLTDNIIMRVTDVFLAIPPILLSVAVVAVLGSNYITLVCAIGIGWAPYFARVVRASLLQIRNKEFIEAARAVGTSDFRIIWRHMLPNISAPIIVQASMGVAQAIIGVAGISFIGLGIQPPAPEWGTMLGEGQSFLRNSPHTVIVPGVCIMITALAINLIGDGLRDALDPKLKD